MGNKVNKIAIIGDGGWGTTLASLLCGKCLSVTMWGAFPSYVDLLNKKRENVKFLPRVKIPKEITITSSLTDALQDAAMIVLAVPSQFMRSVLKQIAPLDIRESLIVSVAKGIENETLLRISEIVEAVLGKRAFGVLSGPTIAQEVANGVPTTAVASSADSAIADTIQDVFFTDRFRIYTNTDVVGVELGGSLKNIIAIAAGISDGLGFGTNAKAALLTRGLAETVRLGVAAGAKKETFFGLSGLGDLTTTCMSRYSRNRWFGEEVGRRKKIEEILSETEMIIEGIATAKSAFALAKKFKIEMPITEQIYLIVHENKDPEVAVSQLMTRSRKSEAW